MNNWKFTGKSEPHAVQNKEWPEAPPWRRFARNNKEKREQKFVFSEEVSEIVNAAICLRRPILVTGKPGTGKTSLARAIARELQLEPVLDWPINTRTTLQDGLYYYDAIARLQDAQLETERPNIGKYIRLGALGTAMYPSAFPRVLLIDEIDKSDIDLPNDLLNLFEEGRFEIPELSRIADRKEFRNVKVQTHDGAWKPVFRGQVNCV